MALAATCVLALLIAAYVNHDATRWLLSALFLLSGSLQVWWWPGRAFYPMLAQTIRFLGVTAVLLVCWLGALLFYFHRFDATLVLLAFSAYLLPAAIALLWPMFRSVNEVPVTVWSYSQEMPHWKSTIFLNSIPVRFQVRLKKPPGKMNASFKAPVRMQLGLIFFHMVQEQNGEKRDPVRLTDEDNHPFRWVFYVKTLVGWRLYLDPQRSLSENNIKPNTLIVAQQLTVLDLLKVDSSFSNQSNPSQK